MRLLSFQGRHTKLDRFLHKNQFTRRILLYLVNWCSSKSSKSAKIWLSKWIFSVKNSSNLSKKKIHWRISIQEHIFCYWNFLLTLIFETLYFLNWCPIFDDSLLHQFSKYNNFLLVYWFLGKNLSNFVCLSWKLNNRNNSKNVLDFALITKAFM